ncbi:MAG: LysM peptidoglycan-binding domain-containing protein [Pseudomonadota bacterium]
MEPAKTGTSMWVSGTIMVAVGVAGATGFYVLRDNPSVTPQDAAIAQESAPAQASAPEIAEVPEEEASAGTPPADAPSAPLPTFDTVRVDPEGQSLIAGKAAPEARVEVLIDGEPIAATGADGSGQFVIFAEVPAGEVVRVMSLRASLGDELVESAETILIQPVSRPATVAGLEEPGSPAVEDAPALSLDEPDVVAETTATEAEPEVPRLLLADEDGITVVQSPEVMSSVALDTITYSDAGEVSLGGRALGEGFIRIYLDDQPVTTSRIEADGSWRSALPDVDTGVYQLRVDELDAGGQVTSRVETPFRREDPEVVAEINASPAEIGPLLEDVMTVQPGATLWAIARERYGEGRLYVKVFEANADRIRDPDMIFPGQVFDLPE